MSTEAAASPSPRRARRSSTANVDYTKEKHLTWHAEKTAKEPKDDEYEVESIVEKRVKGSGASKVTQYKVRWVGYGPKDDTWEPLQTLHSAKALVQAFERAERQQQKKRKKSEEAPKSATKKKKKKTPQKAGKKRKRSSGGAAAQASPAPESRAEKRERKKRELEESLKDTLPGDNVTQLNHHEMRALCTAIGVKTSGRGAVRKKKDLASRLQKFIVTHLPCKVIGITGTIGAGKGTIVEYLTQHHGYTHISVRQLLNSIIKERGMPEGRDSMTEVANGLRAEGGPASIVDKMLKQAFVGGKNCIIESIRTTGEAVLLQKHGAKLISVDANIDQRYERAILRGSETDKVSKEKFKEDEEREWTNTDPNKQNLKAVMEMADIKLSNDGTVEEFHKQLAEMLEGPQFSPPAPVKMPVPKSGPAKSAPESSSAAQPVPPDSTAEAAKESAATSSEVAPKPADAAASAEEPQVQKPGQRTFKLVGITGTLGAGKDDVVAHLKSKFNYEHMSVDRLLTQIAEQRDMPANPDSKTEVANALREKSGPAVIVQKMLAEAEAEGKNCIIESITTPAEAELLQKAGGRLLSVDAPLDIRYGRIVKDSTETDKVSKEKFKEDEEREWTNTDPNKQNLKAVMAMADIKLNNSTSLEDLHATLDVIF